MLAGVLLDLCFAPVRAVGAMPALALPVVLAWLIVARFKRLYAVPVALLVAILLIVATTHAPGLALWSGPVLITPTFSIAALVGIALPLYIVTMASQNVPGLAVLNANGYAPSPGPLLTSTGLMSMAAAPFGGHSICLAAITAALCAGKDAHPDPSRRYVAAVAAGVTYVVLGLLSGAAIAFISLAPPLLIEAVAGLALLGAFGSAMMAAIQQPSDREAAVITFLVTASGLTLFGIGGAFWGLVAGGIVYGLGRWRS
jgi:benzoate membrane transport protein